MQLSLLALKFSKLLWPNQHLCDQSYCIDSSYSTGFQSMKQKISVETTSNWNIEIPNCWLQSWPNEEQGNYDVSQSRPSQHSSGNSIQKCTDLGPLRFSIYSQSTPFCFFSSQWKLKKKKNKLGGQKSAMTEFQLAFPEVSFRSTGCTLDALAWIGRAQLYQRESLYFLLGNN